MAIGDLVASLSIAGVSGTVYTLHDNPGGFFEISGSNLVEAAAIPAGEYSISILAAGPGFSSIQPFVLNFAGDGGPILDLSKQSNVELFPGAL